MHSNNMKADDLRDAFLSFFASKGHKIIESDSLVPKDDPTVLFTPAGMNQFKKQFLGLVGDYRRAATSQRCLRTGDLENVGRTPFHHTFFEMLGNFSFGDYFKQEAIVWAWEFLTKALAIAPQKLWVSVYTDDDEAFRIWRKTVNLPAERIVRLGDKTNFWPAQAKEKGPNGPCGPCSEIFFDWGPGEGCGEPSCSPACDCGRFVEVWNLVFTQFNRIEGGVLEPLPQKNIDTGMGLERLASVTQGVKSNFETDLFQPIIKEIERHSVKRGVDAKSDIYAVADHVRAITFAIFDGVLPSNEGRGYVIRKLIRKSIMHLRNLGFNKKFLFTLVPLVAETLRQPYSEVEGRRENIAEIILAEEQNFNDILDSSPEKIRNGAKEVFASARNDRLQCGVTDDSSLCNASGHTASAFAIAVVRFYDTDGIPLEMSFSQLSDDLVRNEHVTIEPVTDEVHGHIERELSRLKTIAKSQSAMKGDVFDAKELHLDVAATAFVGYETNEAEARVLKLLRGTAEVETLAQGDEARVILDRTPFYGESGGQVGDAGVLTAANARFEVSETKKSDAVIVHVGKVAQGELRKGETVKAAVDPERRLSIARNHTAAHLLQAALRQVLGEHVQQQGSLVAPERLRFDFTHFKQVTASELERVEEVVNAHIMRNEPLRTSEMSLAEAKKAGALAFFGEKYDERVRMVSIAGISKELCGGTHLSSTGSIGLFKIVQEGSVASGIRRIEALTGDAAYAYVRKRERYLAEVAASLSVPVEKASEAIESKLARIAQLEKQLSAMTLEKIKLTLDAVIAGAEDIRGIHFIAKEYPFADMHLLRQTADLIKAKAANTIVLLSTVSAAGISIALAVTKDLCARGVDASALIKAIAGIVGGSGGGRKDFAQAGGNSPGNREEAIQKLKALIGQVAR